MIWTPIVIDYLDEGNIEIHRTRAHPAFAERSIRTIKEMLYERVEADEKRGSKTYNGLII